MIGGKPHGNDAALCVAAHPDLTGGGAADTAAIDKDARGLSHQPFEISLWRDKEQHQCEPHVTHGPAQGANGVVGIMRHLCTRNDSVIAQRQL